MSIEQVAYATVKAAIQDYNGYSIAWDKIVYTVDDFDGVPNGRHHRGSAPSVLFNAGATASAFQVAENLYEGEMEIEILLLIEKPLVRDEDWNDMHLFSCDIKRALTTVEGNGIVMKPGTTIDKPTGTPGLMMRILTITLDTSECRTPITTSAPVNATPPSISGFAIEGQTLTRVEGIWTGLQPITLSGIWQSDGVDIAGETGATYIVDAGLEGETITYFETAQSPLTPPVVTQASNGLVVTAEAAPANTVAPAVTPDPPNETDLLTTTDGTWTGNPAPTFTYQWYKDTVLIGGATASTHQLTVGDASSDFYCEVTGTNFVDSDSADSNTVTAASGYDSFPAPFDFFTGIKSAEGTEVNASLIRVDSTETDIPYDGSGDFDSAAWDTATGANVETIPDVDSWDLVSGVAVSGDDVTDNSVTQSGFIKIDVNTSSFIGLVAEIDIVKKGSSGPLLFIGLRKGTSGGDFITFDEFTGEYGTVPSNTRIVVMDNGTFWTFKFINTTSDTKTDFRVSIYPARTSTQNGSVDVTLTNTIAVPDVRVTGHANGLAYTVKNYDNDASGNDAVQSTEPNQYLKIREGTDVGDSTDKLVATSVSMTSTTDFSITTQFLGAFGSSSVIIDCVKLKIENTADDEITLSGTGLTTRAVTVADFNDGSLQTLCVTYNSTTGYVLDVNSTDYAVTASSGALASGTNSVTISTPYSNYQSIKDGASYTAQEITDIQAWVLT